MHEKLEWLKPDKIKDASGKRSNHPDYNPRTLFVPEQFMKEQTPAMYVTNLLMSVSLTKSFKFQATMVDFKTRLL